MDYGIQSFFRNSAKHEPITHNYCLKHCCCFCSLLTFDIWMRETNLVPWIHLKSLISCSETACPGRYSLVDLGEGTVPYIQQYWCYIILWHAPGGRGYTYDVSLITICEFVFPFSGSFSPMWSNQWFPADYYNWFCAWPTFLNYFNDAFCSRERIWST